MRLEPAFLMDVMRVMTGRVVMQEEAAILANRLGSSEELLAWIFLRQHFGDAEPQIAQRLIDLARNNTVRAETRRIETNYPLDLQRINLELESRLKELLDASVSMSSAASKAYDCAVGYSFHAKGAESIRHILAIVQNKQG